jgi:hypothetical protein
LPSSCVVSWSVKSDKRETNQNPINFDGVLMVYLLKKRFKPTLKLIGLVSALLPLG